jgi:hypothetical protein
LIVPTLSALADDDVLVVATTGGRPVASVQGPVPPNARIEPYVPYEHLLPRVDAMVTNGGYGGVQLALAHGLPLAIAGDGEDKPEVGARVAWSRVGLDLRTGRPRPATIRTAVHRLLTEPTFRARAATVQAEMRGYNGTQLVADTVEELASSARPSAPGGGGYRRVLRRPHRGRLGGQSDGPVTGRRAPGSERRTRRDQRRTPSAGGTSPGSARREFTRIGRARLTHPCAKLDPDSPAPAFPAGGTSVASHPSRRKEFSMIQKLTYHVSHGRFEGRRALITGGAQGLGYSVARRLGAEGAALGLIDLNNDAVTSAAEKLVAEGYDVASYGADVTDIARVKEIVADFTSRGNIDVLVPAAGIFPVFDFSAMTMELWRKIVDINLGGLFSCASSVLPVMKKQGYGLFTIESGVGV